MHVTYEFIVSVFSSKWKDLHAWNNCSLVLPIFEYCCLNRFCKPCQSMFIGSKDSYHNLASPTNARQNLWTLVTSQRRCVFIQSLVLSKWVSASSSHFPVNSGLQCGQFKFTTCCACCEGCCACFVGCVGFCTCHAGCGWAEGGGGAVISDTCGPALPYFICFNFTMPCYSIFYSVKLTCL